MWPRSLLLPAGSIVATAALMAAAAPSLDCASAAEILPHAVRGGSATTAPTSATPTKSGGSATAASTPAAPGPGGRQGGAEKPRPIAATPAIGPVVELSIAPGRSKLLRAAANIRRAAVVDSRVSDVIQVGPRDVVLLGKGVGKTDVTIWIGDQTPQPVVVLVRVLRD